MNTAFQKIIDEALRLPQEARAALASYLLESLEEETDSNAESAWSKEIAKRLSEIDSGQVQLIPWSEARKRILSGSDAQTVS